MSFEAAVLEQAIKKIFTGRHFSICDVDDAAELLGVNPKQHPNYKLLNALHCVHFSDMSKEILNGLQEKVAECLRPTFHPAMLTKAILSEGNDHMPTEDKYLIN